LNKQLSGDAGPVNSEGFLRRGWVFVDPPASLKRISLEVLAVARNVFALPAERKKQFVDPADAGQSGWLAKARSDRPDEIWQLGGDRETRWPTELNASLGVIEELRKRSIDMTMTVLAEAEQAAGVIAGTLTRRVSPPHSFVRLLHYAPRSQGISFAPHTDLGLATFFAGETTPGLEFYGQQDGWLENRSGWAIAGGDMLPALCGDGSRAGLHRVRSMAQERWAVAVFVHPEPGCQVGMDAQGKPLAASAFFQQVRAAGRAAEGGPRGAVSGN
jgi:isopenicillin N synthase-like dioxygenase